MANCRGCLLTYLWFKGMVDRKGRPIKQPKFWLMFYVHRYVRLGDFLDPSARG